MKIRKERFGSVEGMEITLYTLVNDNGVEVSVMNYGATVTSVLLPVGNGNKRNIVCGFDTLEGYFSDEFLSNAPYFGATIGRYCATIQNASYDDVKLSANVNNTHCLHGGVQGFDKKVWGVIGCDSFENESSITLKYFSPDGDQGFPGNVTAVVIIALNNNNELSFRYEADTDKRTPLSMTNHTYLYLSCFFENVEGHNAYVAASNVLPMNPSGSVEKNIIYISGSSVDLRSSRNIGQVHNEINDGFEHFYMFDKGFTDVPEKVAEINCPSSNVSMEVLTTEEGMLLYTAKYTSSSLQRNESEKYGKYCAFCCETHRVPNGPNLKDANKVFTDRGEKFESHTIFKFNF